MSELLLPGCAPTPLASYLKAVGVLRLVGRQMDPAARGWWRSDEFHLRSTLDVEGLMDFLLDCYRPTPVLSPWNRSSGFHGEGKDTLARIGACTDPRLAAYRDTIEISRTALTRWGLGQKRALVTLLRATWPDEALDWLDAAVVLTNRDPEYPPLLGTGGVDGRLEFSRNFMERLGDVLPGLGADPEMSRRWLRAALCGEGAPPLRAAGLGMFDPGGTGGVNATTGVEGDELVNPWDFVLAMEGAVLFAGSAARRLAATGSSRAAFPFTVEASPAGLDSGRGEEEEIRAEVWMPLWCAPAGLEEVERLCAEGRVEWQRRQARDAVEFAAAIARLGVARGIASFTRFAIQKRRGKAYSATPVSRVWVRHRPEADLLAQIDPWLRRVRDSIRYTGPGGDRPPASLRERRWRLEQACFDLCERGGARAAQALLIELGRTDRGLAACAGEARPHRPLTLHADWLARCDDGTPEFRLATALASIGAGGRHPIRANLEPVAMEEGHLISRVTPSCVWRGAGVPTLAAVLPRRLLDAERVDGTVEPLAAARCARLTDIRDLLADQVDAERLADLAAGLSLIDHWGTPTDPPGPVHLPATLARAYVLLKLCFLAHPLDLEGDEREVRPDPSILAALESGRTEDAVTAAARRLHGVGLRLHAAAAQLGPACHADADRMRVALLLPVSTAAASALAAAVSLPREESEVHP